MSISIDQSFVRQFEAEVHEAYQRMGSKFRQTVRAKGSVRSSSTTFQKVGHGSASTKSRHGLVPVMTIDHTAIECVLTDYYAGDWIDKLDEMKINIDERYVIANAGAYALGRKIDELIIGGLDASTNYAGLNTDGLTKDKILTAFEMMGSADIPDDGQRFAVIGWKQWAELLDIPEFANAEICRSGFAALARYPSQALAGHHLDPAFRPVDGWLCPSVPLVPSLGNWSCFR